MFLSLLERGQSQLTTGAAVSLCPHRAVSCGTRTTNLLFWRRRVLFSCQKGKRKLQDISDAFDSKGDTPVPVSLAAPCCRMGRTSLSLCQASQGHQAPSALSVLPKELENAAAQIPRHRIAQDVLQSSRDTLPGTEKNVWPQSSLHNKGRRQEGQHGKGHHSHLPLSLLSSCSTIYKSFARHRVCLPLSCTLTDWCLHMIALQLKD